jgi:hypothetical protein
MVLKAMAVVIVRLASCEGTGWKIIWQQKSLNERERYFSL